MMEITPEVYMRFGLCMGALFMICAYALVENLMNNYRIVRLNKFITANKLWDKYEAWRKEDKINKIKCGN